MATHSAIIRVRGELRGARGRDRSRARVDRSLMMVGSLISEAKAIHPGTSPRSTYLRSGNKGKGHLSHPSPLGGPLKCFENNLDNLKTTSNAFGLLRFEEK